MIGRAACLAVCVGILALIPASASAAAFQCTGPNQLLFDGYNTGGVRGGGTPPTFDTGGQTYCVSQVATYHANATQVPGGRISLVGQGTTVGPFQADASGSDWIANFSTADRTVLINGTYQCRDSDPATWSQNDQSNGRGFCRVFAQLATATGPALSGTVEKLPNGVRAQIAVGGTAVSSLRLDLNPAVNHTGAAASVNGGPPTTCGPFQGSTKNLVCDGVNAPPGATVRIDVTTDAQYPDNGGGDAYADGVGPFGLTGPGTAPQAVAPPEQLKTVNAKTVSGTVLVKPPGGGFAPVGQLASIPVGSIVDARKGRVRITARGKDGEIITAELFEGQFKIVQLLEKGITLFTELQLFGGSFKRCPAGQRTAAKQAAKVKSVRHLWAVGTGTFRTKGRFSATSIRGTQWLTDDQCAGTLTRVTQGSVVVRDFVKRKSVVVKAPRRYLAKAPKKRR